MRAGSQAIDAATALRSDRATRRVHTLAIRALDLYPAAPAVSEFADAVGSRLPIAYPRPRAQGETMQWTVHGRRTIYDSPCISLDLVDVEQPSATSSTSSGWPAPSPPPSSPATTRRC